MHRDECGKSFQDCEWDSKSKIKESSLLLVLTPFDFIICFKIAYIFWSYHASRSMDIINAYKDINIVRRLSV